MTGDTSAGAKGPIHVGPKDVVNSRESLSDVGQRTASSNNAQIPYTSEATASPKVLGLIRKNLLDREDQEMPSTRLSMKRSADVAQEASSKKLRTIADEMDKSAAENIYLKQRNGELRSRYAALQAKNTNMAKQYRSLQSTNKTQATDLRHARESFNELKEANQADGAKITLLVKEVKGMLEVVAKLNEGIQIQIAQLQRNNHEIEAFQDENGMMAEKLRKVEAAIL